MAQVDPNHTFPVDVKYQEKYDSFGILTGITILSDNAEGDDVRHLVCDCTGRDFYTFSQILEAAAVINHITGKPILRASVLVLRVIVTYFKKWNYCDDKGEMVPINVESVKNLEHSIAHALTLRWLRKTGGRSRD